jgi:hypothetical protein
MKDYRRGPDLFGVMETKEMFQPYETPDGWTVVLPGEEDGRRQKYGRKLVAVTRVQIELKDEAALQRCVHELEESDRRLRELSGGNPWDWQKVMLKGLVVRFGVAWYDRAFFQARKNAWSSPQHLELYKRFGASADNFRVEHEIVGAA